MAIDKTTRNRQNAASRARYEAKAYRKLTIRMRTDGADGILIDDIRAAAAADGQSVNAWVIGAIKGRIGATGMTALPPDLLPQVQQAAEMMGISVNDWVLQAIKRSL